MFLEFHLTKAFQNSNSKNIRELWCDGIIHRSFKEKENTYQDKRQFQTKAFIGNDGQTEYEMIIKLGEESYQRCLSDQDLSACVPSVDNTDWFQIDIFKRKIVLQLQ